MSQAVSDCDRSCVVSCKRSATCNETGVTDSQCAEQCAAFCQAATEPAEDVALCVQELEATSCDVYRLIETLPFSDFAAELSTMTPSC